MRSSAYRTRVQLDSSDAMRVGAPGTAGARRRPLQSSVASRPISTRGATVSTIAIVGAGHVGVVYAAGLARLGHSVRVVDIDRSKVRKLQRGRLWFHEPGLADLLSRGLNRKRISFTGSYGFALRDADFVFVCVPTPTTADGSLDDAMLRSAFDAIRRHIAEPPPIIVNKSTVPVGTGDLARVLFEDTTLRIVSSPEFLAEGRAVADFFHPSRIVLGARDQRDAECVARLFSAVRAPIIYTDNSSAEFSKLAANAFLALKISFANALAKICEAVGADIDAVARIIALDPRIGQGHLRPGLGFGGSCLPKDVAALEHLARKHGANAELFAAPLGINREQRTRVIDYLISRFGSVASRRVAILGFAFKAGTDDTRESPSLFLAEQLLALHAEVVVYDPVARLKRKDRTLSPAVARSALAAARGADAVIFATEWPELAGLDLVRLRRVMRGNVLVDGRGVLRADNVRAAGFDHYAFGRRPSSDRIMRDQATPA